MNDVSHAPAAGLPAGCNKVRFVTAASLFDGHDASINIMRRILQATGCEVIHLGHNRSVEEIVNCAIQEDAHGIAISSYQGGHVEFFKYMLDLLRERGAGHIKVFGGGGGVIVAAEIEELHDYGVTRIFSPEDGQKLGPAGDDQRDRRRGGRRPRRTTCPESIDGARPTRRPLRAHARARADDQRRSKPARCTASVRSRRCCDAAAKTTTPVLGITGTGGAGKSSLTDELVRRFRLDQQDKLRIAIISIDPSRRKSGGALLGDRIRMNAIHTPNIYMRSLATRDAGSEISKALPDAIADVQGRGLRPRHRRDVGHRPGRRRDRAARRLSLYVMTPEFGAASQLEKIDMLDFADFVAINKFDRKGAHDALRDVRKQYQRNRELFKVAPDEMPVFGTIASRFNDDGVTALYQAIAAALREHGMALADGALPHPARRASRRSSRRSCRRRACATSRKSRRRCAAITWRRMRRRASRASGSSFARRRRCCAEGTRRAGARRARSPSAMRRCEPRCEKAARHVAADQGGVRRRRVRREDPRQGDPHGADDDVAVGHEGAQGRAAGVRGRRRDPALAADGERARQLSVHRRRVPVQARERGSDADVRRRRRRVPHQPALPLLADGMPAKRLSTAFDSVTLYGNDPDRRPDIYGKVGNSGVSIATLDDMKVLYSGFDLLRPEQFRVDDDQRPAPTILAMFMNTAIDQQLDKFAQDNGREPTDDEAAKIRAWTLSTVRGTVQADILKEDQGQNTCIFSTEFSLKVMGDIQEYFVHHNIRNFYSVSISGYHIAEAGANPISQLAFTLSNGFTFVEAYLARGMHIDDFAPNLSFFFSYGMDPEYAVIGRVARRIWAVAMRERYGANERSQKLKFHSQTSGRSLHAQEIAFNDIRTTLQALISTYDNTNSLHTNAYDEAITTPTEESVRRAMAIQLIINREWGVGKNENPNQGIVHHRRADGARRGGGAEGVRGDLRARRRARRDGDRVPARQDPGRVAVLRALASTTAAIRSSASTRSAIRTATPRRRRSSSRARPTTRKQSQLARLADFHARHARRGARSARAAASGR